MVRIEIHLDKTETYILDAIAKEDGRSRKNLCENEIRKLIKERGQKIKTATKNIDTRQ
jgi:hypothetical protein